MATAVYVQVVHRSRGLCVIYSTEATSLGYCKLRIDRKSDAETCSLLVSWAVWLVVTSARAWSLTIA